MRALLSLNLMSARFGCLLMAVFVYALFGSPTPNTPGLIEFIVAIFLMCAAGVPGLYHVLKPQTRGPFWMAAGRLLLFYGLTVCLMNGVMRGNDSVHILRDAAPFLFFLLPLFLHRLIVQEKFKIWFAAALIFAGLVFSLRSVPEILGWWVPHLYSGELYYFANAPSVLFAVLLLVGIGGRIFLTGFSLRAALICIVCFALALIPLSILLFSLQRASAAIAFTGILFMAGAAFYRIPRRAIVLALLAGLLALPFLGIVDEFGAIMLKKTGEVGLNMRSEEFAAVWQEISRNPLTALLGTGWGGMFESPAVAGIRVNYTHSLLSAMLLKGGLAGLTLTVLYLTGLALTLFRSARHNIVLAVALAGPIAIDVFLYASYKSLDFGLILLLAAIAAPSSGPVLPVAPQRRVLYSNLYNKMSFE